MTKIKGQEGFTFIEVLMAAGILGASTMILLSLANFNGNTMATDNDRILGTTLASNIMENLLEEYAGTPDLLPSGNPHNLYYDQFQNSILSTANPMFTATWNITLDSPTTGIMTINLTVAWGTGSTQSVSITTYRSEE